MSDENKTGLVVGRLSISELLYLIEDSRRPELRRNLATWMLCLSEQIQKNRKLLEHDDYELVISLPLVKPKRKDK